jgi:tetratricopeptide (TPR) repeat protein
MKIVKIITVVFLITAVSCAFASDQKISGKAKTDMRSANMYHGQGLYNKSIPMYESILESNPDIIEIHLKLANYFYYPVDDEKGHIDYFKAHSYFTKASESITGVYNEYEEMKKTDEKAAAKFHKKTIKKGKLEEVSENVEKHISSCWVKIFNSSIALINEEKFDEALEALNKLKDIAPNNIKTYKLIAQVYSKQDNPEAVLNTYKTIIEIDPTDIAAIISLAKDYHNNQDYENAIAYYNKAIEAEPETADHVYNAAVCYAGLDKNDKAKEMYIKVLELEPENVNVALNLSSLADRDGDLDETLKYLRIAVDADPENAGFLENYCWRLSNAKKYDELLIYAEKWKALAPDSENATNLINLAKQKLK